MTSFQIYHSVTSLPHSWDSIVVHDIFLQSSYFKALEEASPNNIQFFYVGIFDEEVLVGVAIIQRVQLYLKDMFRNINVSCVKEFFRDMVSKALKGNILVVGNLMHTGQHGLFFQKENISQTTYLNLVFEALYVIKNHIKTNQNKTIRAIMFKDYFLDDSIHLKTDFFSNHKLHKVKVQPNMILKLQPNWLSFKDYISALNKKYKRRYKTARNKLNGIRCSELSLGAVKASSSELHALYLNVSNNAKFNTFILPENHFYNLKLQLQNRFRVFGYYLNEELVGFFTLIENEKHLETYFLGYDEAHQYKNQLYLNMLYSMLEFGISNHFKTVVYARTAMEIKSSVGAKPEPMVVYIKHTNSFINAVLKQVFGLMNPKQKWQERHPFHY
ncbi:GNAT family N-acetyltransferase [Mariniflexile litorale]|uniref:GNAT family N-acetyltransferase n=1 Tax=Mariniflexile litorale TaxID=3045158 RepID=A0AAU7EL23_9FLAO|nr:GNAT family N-acetyltransferase [Mariniflexile sp. KMM 9835]MDQ8211303.1 GNAT family N-acetyltransferase [Mariniflexile sp. KMM 9835]